MGYVQNNITHNLNSNKMKNIKLISSFTFIVIIIVSMAISCKQKKQDVIIPEEQESMYDALRMDTAITHLHTYHDSVLYAQVHAPSHAHHYDSIFHHHDSLYHQHHTNYHHGDSTHHHTGWHHTPTQHHHHDSLHNVHHILIH